MQDRGPQFIFVPDEPEVIPIDLLDFIYEPLVFKEAHRTPYIVWRESWLQVRRPNSLYDVSIVGAAWIFLALFLEQLKDEHSPLLVHG